MSDDDPVRLHLVRAAELLELLGHTLRRAADELSARPAPGPQPSAQQTTEDPGHTWDELVAHARQLIADEPDSWTAAELLDALRRSGIQRPSWRGVHVKLLNELQKQGEVEQVDGKFRRTPAHSMPALPKGRSPR